MAAGSLTTTDAPEHAVRFASTLVGLSPAEEEDAPTSLAPASSPRATLVPRGTLEQPPPRYDEDRPIARGGMAEVIAAVDRDIGRTVAVKRLLPGRSAPGQVARFLAEIRTVGALEHPNIVPIHDVGVDERGAPWFVMRLVEGETLEAIIARLASGDAATHREWPFSRRVEVFRKLLDAVAFAHERGVIHRDIKPANVMIGRHGETWLMDWGIAKAPGRADTVGGASPEDDGVEPVSLAATQHGVLVGTPLYMAPEQARGGAVDERTDVYALSVLFHELLTTRHYLADATTQAAALFGVMSTDLPFATDVKAPGQPPVPMDLAWFVRKGVAKEPAMRYPTVQAMIDRLDARARGKVPVQCPGTLTKRVAHEGLALFDRYPILPTVLLVSLALYGAYSALSALRVL